MIVTSIRMDTATHERFKVYAAAQRRSLSNQLRILIEEAVNEYEREEAA
jgi:predicted DNA-binding protein